MFFVVSDIFEIVDGLLGAGVWVTPGPHWGARFLLALGDAGCGGFSGAVLLCLPS